MTSQKKKKKKIAREKHLFTDRQLNAKLVNKEIATSPVMFGCIYLPVKFSTPCQGFAVM